MNPEITLGLPTKLIDDRAGLPKAKNSLGKDDFMKLLLSQLRHQDPLKPMDHQEFASQLAQFGQLEQLTNIGTGISGLKTGMGEDAKMQAIGMIGKRIQANGAEVELISGQPVTLNASFSDSVKPVKAVIMNGSGKTIREMNLDGKSKEILWDGKDQEGVLLPSGKYLFRVHGVGPNGQAQEAGSELSGRVVGVDIDGAQPSLVIQTPSGQTKIALPKVKQVLIDSEPQDQSASPKKVQAAHPQQSINTPAIETPVEDNNEPVSRTMFSLMDPAMELRAR